MVKKPKKTAKKAADPAEAVIAAALGLAAERGWRSLSMTDIATAAGLSLGETLRVFPSKTALLNGLIRRTDDRVLAGTAGGDEGESARDRLFDVLMRRFDALVPYKAGLCRVVRDTACDPLAMLCHLPRLGCSMALMLEAAGIGSTGPEGMLRTKGLIVVYANAFRVWLADDSPDMAKTMAALDNGLRRAERLAELCWGRRRAGPDGEDEIQTSEA